MTRIKRKILVLEIIVCGACIVFGLVLAGDKVFAQSLMTHCGTWASQVNRDLKGDCYGCVLKDGIPYIRRMPLSVCVLEGNLPEFYFQYLPTFATSDGQPIDHMQIEKRIFKVVPEGAGYTGQICTVMENGQASVGAPRRLVNNSVDASACGFENIQ